jgi:hypothetical protein
MGKIHIFPQELHIFSSIKIFTNKLHNFEALLMSFFKLFNTSYILVLVEECWWKPNVVKYPVFLVLNRGIDVLVTQT